MLKNLQINIFDYDLNWKAMLDSVGYLVHRKHFTDIVYSEMRVSKQAPNIEELIVGRIIVINNDNDYPLIVEEMQTSIDETEWVVRMVSLKGMLNYRICHPTDTGTYTAKKQSEVMMIIPFDNLVSQARDKDRYFWNSARTINMFAVENYKFYGDSIDYKVDWETGLMGDAIAEIAKMNSTAGSYPIGWNIYINDTWQYYHMDTYLGTDRSVLQTVRPAVIFSDDFGNVKTATYVHSIKDWKNVTYVKWNDTNNTTWITPIGNTHYGATVSFNRREMITNSNQTTTAGSNADGRADLNSRPHSESFSAEIIDNENTISTFNLDWFLGDIVTIQSKDLALSVNAQVIQVEETYENNQYNIDVTFGEPKPNFIQLIKNAIRY
jgi:Siphovirus ReqiPepy6 Gp37-like protein